MSRNLRIGEMREDILADLRTYDPLVELLDTSDYQTMETVENTNQQIYSTQSIQDTDFPIGVEIGLIRSGGSSTQSTASADVIVQATVNARLNWRQAVDQDPDRPTSETEMDRILDAVGARADIAFSIPYLVPGGLVGGADMLENEEGAQWSLPARWEVTRTVFGNDGPRSD